MGVILYYYNWTEAVSVLTIIYIVYYVINYIFLVMRPISARSKLVLNKEESASVPKLLADFILEEIDLLISRQQVGCIIEIVASQDPFWIISGVYIL